MFPVYDSLCSVAGRRTRGIFSWVRGRAKRVNKMSSWDILKYLFSVPSPNKQEEKKKERTGK